MPSYFWSWAINVEHLTEEEADKKIAVSLLQKIRLIYTVIAAFKEPIEREGKFFASVLQIKNYKEVTLQIIARARFGYFEERADG